MASAILTLTDPAQFGVIDIRVWKLLLEEGVVSDNPSGTSFTPKRWCTYLEVIRPVAAELRVTARDVERTLFEVAKVRQKGPLYPKSGKGRCVGGDRVDDCRGM